MKERPILFSAPMVLALLDRTKTQTRRIAKLTDAGHVKETGGHRRWHPKDRNAVLACPYGQPGDRLWVRETWAVSSIYDDRAPSKICDHLPRGPGNAPCGISYRASGGCVGLKLRTSIHMPRWASRITLEIVSVRIERLQDISPSDVLAEGLGACIDCDAHNWMHREGIQHGHASDYEALWESINGTGSWALNPLVWVIEFKAVPHA